MAAQKNVLIILGNGFSIDLMKTIGKTDEINLGNLFACGADVPRSVHVSSGHLSGCERSGFDRICLYQLEDGASQAQWCKVVWESVYSPAVCSYAHYGSLPTAFRWVSENASAGMCRSDDSFFCNVSSHLHYNVY